MKRFFTATAATALALSLLAAPMASAQQMPQNHDDQRPPTAHNAPAQHAQVKPGMMSQAPSRPAGMAENRPAGMNHPQAPEQHSAMAPRPPVQQHSAEQSSHGWRNGDRYTGDRRVVSDWGRYHANPPPAGYEWVQDGNELVLISITSGIIASILANAVYQ